MWQHAFSLGFLGRAALDPPAGPGGGGSESVITEDGLDVFLTEDAADTIETEG